MFEEEIEYLEYRIRKAKKIKKELENSNIIRWINRRKIEAHQGKKLTYEEWLQKSLKLRKNVKYPCFIIKKELQRINSCITDMKSELEELKIKQGSAMVTETAVDRITVICYDGQKRCIPLSEFALYIPTVCSHVSVNVSENNAHLIIYHANFEASDDNAVYASIRILENKKEKLIIFNIPYCYFGTTDIDVFKTDTQIDVFCVDGEYYPAPSCIEKLSNNIQR